MILFLYRSELGLFKQLPDLRAGSPAHSWSVLAFVDEGEEPNSTRFLTMALMPEEHFRSAVAAVKQVRFYFQASYFAFRLVSYCLLTLFPRRVWKRR